MRERPNLLIAATISDAAKVKKHFPQFSSWHVMTPRTNREHGWMYGEYIWTPEAKDLPARVRWELRQRLVPSTDEYSEEKAFPTKIYAW